MILDAGSRAVSQIVTYLSYENPHGFLKRRHFVEATLQMVHKLLDIELFKNIELMKNIVVEELLNNKLLK